ncbi:hypothetical protein EOW65_03835 [Sinirhodobacter ferrireducens]|uniref:Uncharacterized protein n=1 Tax=Paenirhodobacter ferrireducens TaxID=1215032 RepID=A0A443LQA2_9RHOB|nr:hypothetical protein [Sinirhodobacter ferrireducens]RWR51307.1 hypothetical protein EOW65_03835 [Sinirhodobacter ferrireducens]
MKLQSCQNCWFNGLQYGSIGLPVGYCTRHRKVLNRSDETTCGLHIRKDLGLARAQQVLMRHKEYYEADKIVRIESKAVVESDFSSSDKDVKILCRDQVGDAAVEYGLLGSKIESLAQLNRISSARSDIAFSSLGRAYVRNCVRNGGRWTSGIHMYWWTKKRLENVPSVEVGDLRYSGSLQLSRQTDLAIWSVMMLQLSFIEDIVQYADEQKDEIGQVKDITNQAALAVPIFNIRKLSNWIKNELFPALEARLDYKRYSEISRDLHKDVDDK